MKQEQITENNNLIAEFDGLKWVTSSEGVRRLTKGDWHPVYKPDALKYHSSWDWLMPVVEKIWGIIGNRESLWYFDVSEITDEEMFIHNNREYDGNNRADCYSAVVEFIKWYNEKK